MDVNMASVTKVHLVDDVDGGEAVESIAFGLDGTAYDIDLSEKHAAELRDIFAPYVASARRNGGRTPAGRTTMPPASREDGSAIREWAAQNGFTVSSRGRIRREVREAYERQRSAPPAVAALPVDSSDIEVAAKPVKARARKKIADPFTPHGE